MNKSGPIIIIEDDLDDKEIIKEILVKLDFKNETLFFADGNLALEYLNKPNIYPFLILSDVNMPKMDGFELRKRIHTNEQLSLRCIPFLFFTTGVNKKSIIDAYTMSVQGFFQKPNSVQELESTLKSIVEYWQKCISPGSYLV
ncbi:MAG: response regulator [Flavisolibacter sp.]